MLRATLKQTNCYSMANLALDASASSTQTITCPSSLRRSRCCSKSCHRFYEIHIFLLTCLRLISWSILSFGYVNCHQLNWFGFRFFAYFVPLLRTSKQSLVLMCYQRGPVSNISGESRHRGLQEVSRPRLWYLGKVGRRHGVRNGVEPQ